MSASTVSGVLLSVSILLPGVFHEGEVPDGSSGAWMALIWTPSKTMLRQVSLSVGPAHDPVVDAGDEATGREVTIDPAIDAKILIRGLSGLQEGEIPTVLANQAVDASAELGTRFRGIPYRFFVECEVLEAATGPQRQQSCGLAVQSEGPKTILARYTMFEEDGWLLWAAESPPSILWAGDLDGDGMLDALVNTSDHYNVRELTLFLSTAADTPGTMAEAAKFRSVGC